MSDCIPVLIDVKINATSVPRANQLDILQTVVLYIKIENITVNKTEITSAQKVILYWAQL